MNTRTVVAFSLLSLTPSVLLAQSYARAPKVPNPPARPAAPANAPAAPLPPTPGTAAWTSVPPPEEMALVAPPQPPTAPKASAPPAPPTPATAPAPAAPPRPPGQMINVRIEVTLSDSKGLSKTLTMTVADGERAMNRTANGLNGEYSFNADAEPSVVGNKVRLRLTADAVVPVESEKPSVAGPPTFKVGLRQSQTVILSDHESVELARAVDPMSDRAFTLSVKATIVR